MAVANGGLLPVALTSPLRARTDVDTGLSGAFGNMFEMLVLVAWLLMDRGGEDRTGGEDGHEGDEGVGC